MTIQSYQAPELFNWLIQKEDILVLDVRNPKDFHRFHIESPVPFTLLNVSYYDFMEMEEEALARVPQNRPIRIVCAKEGSAKYVAEILERNGYQDLGYLAGGFKSWGNMLIPQLVVSQEGFSLYQFIRPGKASCSYGLLYGQEMMVFDPSKNVDFYQQFAQEKGCRLIKIFETHLQADYISGARVLAQETGATLYANAADFAEAKLTYTPLVDGEEQRFSSTGPTVKVLFTPGHTPGSTSYLIADQYLISGDTVFIASVGRPDLGGQAEAWAVQLYATLGRIKALDPNRVVLPGHYMDWEEAREDWVFAASLETALARNQHIYGITEEAHFIQFIQDNIRPQPDEYAVIRRVNAHLEQVDEEQAEILDLGKNECAATTKLT